MSCFFDSTRRLFCFLFCFCFSFCFFFSRSGLASRLRPLLTPIASVMPSSLPQPRQLPRPCFLPPPPKPRPDIVLLLPELVDGLVSGLVQRGGPLRPLAAPSAGTVPGHVGNRRLSRGRHRRCSLLPAHATGYPDVLPGALLGTEADTSLARALALSRKLLREAARGGKQLGPGCIASWGGALGVSGETVANAPSTWS